MSAIASRDPTKCPNCGTDLSLSEWSESVSENETTHFWCCDVCGREFETRDKSVQPQLSEAELAEEFLPKLVVE
jgi:hypothetical protein